jgi:hypothetical protein
MPWITTNNSPSDNPKKGTLAQKISNQPEVLDLFHSPNVFINQVPVVLWNDPKGKVAAGAAAAIAAVEAAQNSPVYEVDKVVQQTVEGLAGPENAAYVADQRIALVKEGILTPAAIEAGRAVAANPAASDTKPAANPTPTPSGSVELSGVIDNTELYVSEKTGTTYYVKTITKQVTFPYDVASLAQYTGLTVQQICDNLKALVINVIDPIKAQYPDMFLTNSFRFKVGEKNAQHGLGQACDIQYAKASKAEYYQRALWVRDNIPCDQFLLEYQTSPRKGAWHHISFVNGTNRGQVFTLCDHVNIKGDWTKAGMGLFDLTASI